MVEQPVWIDRDSIDKVMMNLLSNAFKYTPDEGTIEIGVEVGTDDVDDLGKRAAYWLYIWSSLINKGFFSIN